jgi:hypothetical protein
MTAMEYRSRTRMAPRLPLALAALAAGTPSEPPSLGPVPVDFLLFGCVLAGVALFHHHTLRVALAGLVVITTYKVLFSPFAHGAGLAGFASHLAHEWVLLVNLLFLLVGFALLSKHFEESRVPAWLPRLLPDDWKGAFALLAIIFVLSSFLDNIAAALIGATIAGVVFRGKVHIGYLPDGKVVGLSKLARVVEAVAKRPQVQERMTEALADLIMFELHPRGVGVIIEASHTCMTIRGVKKPGSMTITSALRGLVKSNATTRAELMSLVMGSSRS